MLDNAFARYPALWVIGLVTAVLTAYYMTRLVSLAFCGDDRWRQAERPAPAVAGHGMGTRRAPRVALGHGAARWSCWRSSPSSAASWTCRGTTGLRPAGLAGPGVRAGARTRPTSRRGRSGRSPIVDAVVALVGLGVAFAAVARRGRAARARAGRPAAGLVLGRRLRRRHRPARTGLRPVLRHGGRRPGHRRRGQRRGAGWPAPRAEACAGCRPGTSAQYALGIVLGAVAAAGVDDLDGRWS